MIDRVPYRRVDVLEGRDGGLRIDAPRPGRQIDGNEAVAGKENPRPAPLLERDDTRVVHERTPLASRARPSDRCRCSPHERAAALLTGSSEHAVFAIGARSIPGTIGEIMMPLDRRLASYKPLPAMRASCPDSPPRGARRR